MQLNAILISFAVFTIIMELQISEEVSLEAQLVMTGRGCVIGQSGSGKSFLMGLITEQLLRLGLPFCVIDTEGEYVSLKDASKGVLIVGGESADVPVDVNFEMLFREGIAKSVPMVIDVSDTTGKADIVYKALGALYTVEEEMRKPYLVLIEEADKFAPQIVHQKINIIEELSVRGRKRGIGLLIATQRPSNISKNVLSQCSYGFIGKLTIENDLSAISQLFNDRSALEEIVNMHTGEFMPFGIEYKQRFRVNGRSSLHMGSTPEVSEVQSPTRQDLSGIISRLTAVQKPAKRQAIRQDEKSVHAEAVPFTFTDSQAKAYADRTSRKMFGIFGRKVEEPQSVEQKYIAACLCTIRVPTGKKREFEEHSILIGSGNSLIKIGASIKVRRLGIKPLRLSQQDENLLRLVRAKGSARKDVLVKKGVLKPKGASAVLKKLNAANLVTLSGDTLKSEDYADFYMKDNLAASPAVLQGSKIDGNFPSEDESELLLKNLYPTCSMTLYSRILLPIYEITLRRGNKVRVFKIDGIKGRELVYA
ncbi:MAG: DUF87 domain-containing protein [Candidatus Marsarchaeota archaeon]|jgi:hypothetical protein|nr:DUF87 domain-containing protein [Candidatus Marsarchaeota archaeon]